MLSGWSQVTWGFANFQEAYYKADTAFNEKRYQEAEAVFREAMTLDPEKIQGHLGLAKTLKAEGLLKEAVQVYEQANKKWPDTREIQLELAVLYAWTKRYEESEQWYRVLLVRDTHDAEAWIGLATLASWQGQLDMAIERFQEALKAFPNSADAYVGLGRTYSWKKENERSEENYLKALRLSPNHEEATSGLLTTYRWTGQTAKALALAENAKGHVTESVDWWIALGKLYQETGQVPKAIQAYERAKKIAPQRAEISTELGLLLTRSAQHEAAVNELKRAVELDRGNVDSAMALARLYSWTDHLDEAIRQYRDVVEAHPKNLEAMSGLARVLFWKGEWQEAETWYQLVLQVDPRHQESRQGLRQLARLRSPEVSGRFEVLRSIEQDFSSGLTSDTREQVTGFTVKMPSGYGPSWYVRYRRGMSVEVNPGFGVVNFQSVSHQLSGEWTQKLGGQTSMVGQLGFRYFPSFSGDVYSSSDQFWAVGSAAFQHTSGRFSVSVAGSADPALLKILGTVLQPFYVTVLGTYGAWKADSRWDILGSVDHRQIRPNLGWWTMGPTFRWMVEGTDNLWVEVHPGYRSYFEDVTAIVDMEWQSSLWEDSVITFRGGASTISSAWPMGYHAFVQWSFGLSESLGGVVQAGGSRDVLYNESWHFTVLVSQRL